MIMRWIWRALAVFLGKKAWEAYQRRQGRPAASSSR